MLPALMKPIDFRNATFGALLGTLEGIRRGVYDTWLHYGPGTTREMSRKSSIDILTFRPRTTELLQCGLLVCADEQPHRKEGTYRIASHAEWNRFRDIRQFAVTAQPQLKMGGTGMGGTGDPATPASGPVASGRWPNATESTR